MGTTDTPLNETYTLRQWKDARSRSRQVATKSAYALILQQTLQKLWGINCNSKMCIIKTSTVERNIQCISK